MEEEVELKILTKEMLDHLTDRERLVVKAHLGFDGELPMTFREVAQLIGRSHERAHQIFTKAIRRLRRRYYEKRAEQTSSGGG